MRELLAHALANIDITIYMYEDEIRYSAPRSQLTPAVLEFLRENKSNLKKFLLDQPFRYYCNSEAGEMTSSLARFRHGEQGNIFFIHPATGTSGCYKGIVQEIAELFAVYGVYAMGYGSSWITHPTIRDMSTHYYNQIRVVQPEGPYLLCGYSLGGIIALEIAAMIQNAGHLVDPVIVIDARRPDGKSGGFLPRGRLSDEISELPNYVWNFFLDVYLGKNFSKLVSANQSFERLDVEQRFRVIANEAHKAKLRDESWDSIYFRRLFEFQTTILRAASTYQSTPYGGDVVYLFAQDEGNHSYVRDFLEPVTGAVKIVAAEGHHLSMMIDKENAKKLGRSINKMITESQAFRARRTGPHKCG